MREILFKAKKKDNGEWVEGCLEIDQSRLDIFKYRIQPIESGALYAPPISPDTICQYTGLADKNGQKIWENDIIKYDKYLPGYIVWDKCACGLYIKIIKTGTLIPFTSTYREKMEVIGNIFDNPDLLEVGV